MLHHSHPAKYFRLSSGSVISLLLSVHDAGFEFWVAYKRSIAQDTRLHVVFELRIGVDALPSFVIHLQGKYLDTRVSKNQTACETDIV